MKVSEGWRRTFIVLSVVYWLPAIYASFELAINENTPTPWDSLLMINLIISALIYGALAGLVAGVIWIMAGFSKSKPDAE